MEKKGNRTAQETNVIGKILSQAQSMFSLSITLFYVKSIGNVRPFPGVIVIIVLLCLFEISISLPTTRSDKRRLSSQTGAKRLGDYPNGLNERAEERSDEVDVTKKPDFPFGRVLRKNDFWTVLCISSLTNLPYGTY